MELNKLKITARRYGFLQKMGITTLEQLLKTYPFRYENSDPKPFQEWEKGDTVTFTGIISGQPVTIPLGGKRTMTRFPVITWNEEITVTVFNRPWASSFPFGKTITVTGICNGANKVTAQQASTKPPEPGLHPIYTVTKGMYQSDMHAIIKEALRHTDQIEDVIPPELRRKYRLLDKDTALHWIHYPADMDQLHQAVRTLKYEEFLCFQCTVQTSQRDIQHKIPRIFDQNLVETKIRELPYALTEDQRKAVDDILADIRQDKCMYRLVQGDVGCGKTAVAAIALYAAQLANVQAALMAPTEILARQHAENLKGMGLNARLLISALPAKEKQEVLDGLKNGTISIVTGTHSLFQEGVEFENLGLVIADEQQRFGVGQRRQLLEKGMYADFLMMTATPIPRTYAHFLYGDIDLSPIHTMPPGRQPVQTKYIPGTTMKPILKDVLEGLKEGRQLYVVCAAIDENLEMNIQGVTSIYEGMEKVLGKKYNIGLLHGRMSGEEKEEVMTKFKNKELDVLVSTTVIEVGIDVASATMMVIYDAHRFGLAALHQLRGRCARGSVQGKCWLLSGTRDSEAIARLKKMEELKDGFALAAYDLKLRGPGDLLGTRQSGLPAFVLGDLEKDTAMMEAAVADAKEILEKNEWMPMLRYVKRASETVRYMD